MPYISGRLDIISTNNSRPGDPRLSKETSSDFTAFHPTRAPHCKIPLTFYKQLSELLRTLFILYVSIISNMKYY
jgi:hypothetical protein